MRSVTVFSVSVCALTVSGCLTKPVIPREPQPVEISRRYPLEASAAYTKAYTAFAARGDELIEADSVARIFLLRLRGALALEDLYANLVITPDGTDWTRVYFRTWRVLWTSEKKVSPEQIAPGVHAEIERSLLTRLDSLLKPISTEPPPSDSGLPSTPSRRMTDPRKPGIGS